MLQNLPSAGDDKLTPMMAQFIEIKAANPDSLLFYRMGDFYELFFDDAVDASRALGITLTKRGKHLGEDIPMCGVPVHAADDYLQKLIRLGFRVAVCEQTEDPAEAKKRGSKSVVRRDVVRLVTPGTLTEDKLLDPGSANALAALARTRSGENTAEHALAVIDISTGSFRLTSTSPDRLAADLARIEPKELILAESLFDDPTIRMVLETMRFAVVPQPGVLFESARAEDRLASFFNVAALDGFGTWSKAQLAAASAALAYVEKTQIGERPALTRPVIEGEDSVLFIDAATRTNLELTRTLAGERDGSLLKAIDRTVSGAGSRCLAERLMNPLVERGAIEARLDEVAWFAGEQDCGERIHGQLKGLADMPRAVSRLALNRGGPRDLAAVAAGLEAAVEVFGVLQGAEYLPANLGGARATLSQAPRDLMELLKAALADDVPLLKRDGGFTRAGYEPALDEQRQLKDQSRRVIAGLQAAYAEQTGVKGLKIKHNNVLGYFIEVTALNAGALTGDDAKQTFIHRQTMANAMRFTTTELADLESRIANAAGQALQIEMDIFDRLTAAVLDAADTIKAVAEALANLDVAIALAVLALEQGYCRPQIEDDLSFEITAGRHPVVEQMLRRNAENPFVANDCRIGGEDSGMGRLWLLTGPNMGGKSTFLRQNALIAIMAQMGSFVPAGSARIGVVDRLFSRVGAADDLARGRSTFMVEMVETAAILNQATARSLVILDELGRGTATFDGLSIAWAAIEHLHEVNQCRTLFATHYHELTALSAKLDRVANVTMRVKEWEGDVIFLHEVAEGSADRSYGIQVARLAGLPGSVIERARAVLAQLEESDRKSPSQTLIDDLPLFSAKPQARPAPAPNRLATKLASINPDDLSPREALELLYALKADAED